MHTDKKSSSRSDKKAAPRGRKQGVVGYSKKSALLEEAITQMNAGKYGRSSAALKELLALDPLNMEARRLFATLHLRLGSLIPARQAFESLINEALERQDYWLAESLLREYLAAGPRCVPFLEKLGTIYQDKGDSLAAVTEYGKAIDILLEDPDPDNPQHASQLYAKVRDLAPASSVAFRLASFFDAQSGELIAPASAVQSELQQPASPEVPTEETATTLAVSEPLAGIIPQEQIEETATSSTSSGQDVTLPTEKPVSFSNAAASAQADEVLADAQVPLGQSPPETASLSPETHVAPTDDRLGSPDIDRTVPMSFSPTVSQLAQEDLQSNAQSQRTVLPAVPTSDVPLPTERSNSDIDRGIGRDAVPAMQESSADSEQRMTDVREGEIAETISAPMPWERVQEAAINIPERETEDPPAPVSSTAELSPISLQLDPWSVRADVSFAPVPSPDPAVTEDHHTGRVMGQPDGAPSSAPETASPSPPPDNSKNDVVSWESIFASTWKFGGVPSGAGQLQEVPKPDADPAEGLELSTAPSVQEHAHDAGPVQLQQTPLVSAESGLLSLSESAPAPMPWDQVQETTIAIQPIEAEETAASVPAEEGCQPPSPPDPVLGISDAEMTETSQLSGILSPASAVIESETLAYSEPLPGSFSREPEFRIIDRAPASPIDAPAIANINTESVFSAPAQASEPAPPMEPVSFAGAVPPPISESTPAPSPSDQSSIHPTEETVEASGPSSADISLPQLSETSALGTHSRVAPTATVLPIVNELTTDSPQDLPPVSDRPLHWKTGEVAVQTHRPAPKKTKRKSSPAPESPLSPPPVEAQIQAEPEPVRQEEPVLPVSAVQSHEPAHEREAWVSAGESIRFVESWGSGIEVPVARAAPSPQEDDQPVQPVAAAVSAVDVLFHSSDRVTGTDTQEWIVSKARLRLRATLARIRIGIFMFLRSCFSTTRAIVTSVMALVILLAAILVLGIGAVGMIWLALEEKPTPTFQSLTTIPQRTLMDSRKNGYLLLLGFDATDGLDPIQSGYERKPYGKDAELAAACTGGADNEPSAGQTKTSASMAKGWFRTSDPLAQFTRNQDLVKGWVSQGEPAIGRYKQWLNMSFDDWGYGQSVSPPCASILSAHRMYVADGFIQGVEAGTNQLEADMEAWRMVLGQAKTLPIKTMALQAVNEDITVASGLLIRSDGDGVVPDRLAKMLRPLDQVELSLRWPMQSQFVAATKTVDAQLKADRIRKAPLHVRIASSLPLPKQRRFNEYARYYEASYKAAGEGRYASLPKRTNYVRFPATGLLDTLRNPIENLIGLEPLAAWDFYSGLVVDTDAHLRLASLQAWLRRGPPDGELLAQVARAGQNFYDPYTGFPMLVNLNKGVMYSVGHDGKDQDANPQDDVVVAIPRGFVLSAKISSGSPKSK